MYATLSQVLLIKVELVECIEILEYVEYFGRLIMKI